MKVDTAKSEYEEDPEARRDFNRVELRRLKFLFRRLQFLEQRIRETGGMTGADASGGAAFAEWEFEALEWVLLEMNFIVRKKQLERNGS